MSFSEEVKLEIINHNYKNACCRHSVLSGALFAKGYLNNDIIECSIQNEQVALFLRAIAMDYDRNAAIIPSRTGGRRRLLSFRSNSLSKMLTELDRSFSKVSKCAFCEASFIRGAFLACGSASDPQKQFCLEFSPLDREFLFKSFFLDLGIELKVNRRRNETVLYTKNSSVIEDFFSIAQLNRAAFSIMNEKIKNEFMNNANRMRNFDTVNIAKAVEAANVHLGVIRELDDRGLLSSLPEELELTARLRLANPDMSLAQLSMISVPPVSKSGLSHRLTKIKKLGEELLSKYK